MLPSVYKIFESVVHTQLVSYFEEPKLLTKTQYGYRSKHSTKLASLELMDRIYSKLENNVILLRYIWTFPKLCLTHATLLDKLHPDGIRGIAKQLTGSSNSTR